MQACASPRACAVPRPTLQRQGLLWVWAGGGGALAALEAAATPPVLAAELDPDEEGVPTRASDGRKATMRSYYYRELCAPESFAVGRAAAAPRLLCVSCRTVGALADKAFCQLRAMYWGFPRDIG